jgi:hypothetical protein
MGRFVAVMIAAAGTVALDLIRKKARVGLSVAVTKKGGR